MIDFSKAKSPEFWKEVRENAAYAPLIEQVRSYYKPDDALDFGVLKFSARFKYYKDGDRSTFEKPYFHRRRDLSALAILALIEPEREDYIERINDLMFAICDEYSWCLAAHTRTSPGEAAKDPYNVDLFNAETAAMMTLLCEVLGDRIAPAVKERTEIEVRRRVIEPFKACPQPGELNHNNWSAVVSGGTAICFHFLDPESFDGVIERFKASLFDFIDSYENDGTCTEGFSYWIYGFGYFLFLADLVREHTGGTLDVFKEEKVQRMATFPQRCFLPPSKETLSFADGTTKGLVDIGCWYFLCREYPDTVTPLTREQLYLWPGNVGFQYYLRSFLAFDPVLSVPEKSEIRDYVLPDARQVVILKETYACTAKSGNNAEQHNHNDVGHFIFADEDGQALCDLGAGLYTREYFKNETRYQIFCNRSKGHSVPIFDGAEQKAGAEFQGSFAYENSTLTMELAAAYGLDALKSCLRTINFDDTGITLTDCFDYKGQMVTERFVTKREPSVEKGCITIGRTRLVFDPAVTPKVHTETHDLHGFKGDSVPVYCIDFDLPATAKEFSLRVEVCK
ncbi:MAG: heparinase II/III family protein [Clostridia bacterium]|nr:heparinase II/III family protein [Clostridia bacterium]